MIKLIYQKYKSSSKFFKSGFWFTLCGFLQKGISMLCTPFFTRILTKEQFGIANTFMAWQLIINLVVSLSLSRSIMNLYIKYENKKEVLSSVCSLSMIVTLSWTFLAMIFMNPLSKVIGLSKSLILCFFLYSIGDSIVRCWMNFKLYIYDYKPVIFISLFITIISGFGGVFCIIFIAATAEWRIYPQVFVYFFLGLVIYLSLFLQERKFYDKGVWLYSLSFCLGLMPHYFSEFLLQSSDKIMIDRMCGASDVAYYSVAYSVGSLILLFANALNSSFVPYQYQMIQSKKNKILAQTTNFFMTFLTGILLLIMLFGYEIVLVFGGERYLPSVQAIVPICLGAYFNYMFQLFARVQEYYNKKITIVIPSIICAALNILLNYIFIKIYGYIAASYTTFVCFAIFCLIHYGFYRRTCLQENNGELIYDGKFLLILSLVTSILGFVILFIQNIPILKYGFIFIILFFSILKREWIMENIVKLKT
jgi:flippase wzx